MLGMLIPGLVHMLLQEWRRLYLCLHIQSQPHKACILDPTLASGSPT